MENSYLKLLKKKKIALIMSLPANDLSLARAAWENGADVVKVHINVEHRASKTVFKSFAQEEPVLRQILAEARGPCGLVVGGDLRSALRDYQAAVQAGFSFISLYANHMPASILQNKTICKMLALSSDYTLHQVAACEHIGADVLEASVMLPESYGESLSAMDIIQYHTICKHTSLPVIIPTQHKIILEDVPVLWQCGIAGLMLGAVVTGKDAQSIGMSVARFRAAIDAL